MAKFCGKCGTKMEDDEVFCPKCGARVDGDESTNTTTPNANNINKSAQNNSTQNNTLKIIIGVLIALIVIGAGAGFYYYKHTQDNVAQTESSSSASSAAQESSQAASSDAKQDSASQQPVKDNLAQANEIVKSKGLPYTVGAVSKMDDNGFLGLLTGKGLALVVYDKKDDVVAMLDFKKELLDLKNNKTGNTYNRIIFNVQIKGDNASKDSKLGYWNGDTHNFSVFSLYDIDSNGNVVPGMLTSAWGKNPSHYQTYLQEQQNVNIINIALTHADSLAKDINARGVSIP